MDAPLGYSLWMIKLICVRFFCRFWSSIGHPCFVREYSSEDGSVSGSDSGSCSDTSASPPAASSSKNYVPVTPATFLTFFSV